MGDDSPRRQGARIWGGWTSCPGHSSLPDRNTSRERGPGDREFKRPESSAKPGRATPPTRQVDSLRDANGLTRWALAWISVFSVSDLASAKRLRSFFIFARRLRRRAISRVRSIRPICLQITLSVCRKPQALNCSSSACAGVDRRREHLPTSMNTGLE